MRLARAIRARLSRARRRGFALPMVILLALVGGLTIIVVLQRQDAQSRVVETLLGDYQTHHASFGVRAVVKKWVTRQKAEDLSKFASKEGVAHRFILPENTYVSVRVADAQGYPSLLSNGMGPTTQQYYGRFRERVKGRDPNLFRTIGPPAISVNAAPYDVLASLIPDEDDGERLADRLIRERNKKPLDREDVLDEFRRLNLSDEQVTSVMSILTFEPSLWQIQIVVEGGPRTLPPRRFEMTVEAALNSAKVHQWAEVIEQAPGARDDDEGEGRDDARGGRDRGRNSESGSSNVRESRRDGSR